MTHEMVHPKTTVFPFLSYPFQLGQYLLCSFEGAVNNTPSTIPVSMMERPHLFPSRTQKLSSHMPTISGWKQPGKIGLAGFIFLLSSAVEHSAVNRRVVGSNPTGGANKRLSEPLDSLIFYLNNFIVHFIAYFADQEVIRYDRGFHLILYQKHLIGFVFCRHQSLWIRR